MAKPAAGAPARILTRETLTPTSFREHLKPPRRLARESGSRLPRFPPTPYITGMSAGRYELVRGFQRVPQISLITVHSPGVRWPM